MPYWKERRRECEGEQTKGCHVLIKLVPTYENVTLYSQRPLLQADDAVGQCDSGSQILGMSVRWRTVRAMHYKGPYTMVYIRTYISTFIYIITTYNATHAQSILRPTTEPMWNAFKKKSSLDAITRSPRKLSDYVSVRPFHGQSMINFVHAVNKQISPGILQGRQACRSRLSQG